LGHVQGESNSTRRPEVPVAVFRSAQHRTGKERDVWQVLDYCLFGLIVAFLCFVLVMALVGATNGWSANP
jgi:hypothetical protein